MSGWPRTLRRTRSSRRSSSGPSQGVPDNPGAWLMAVARRRGVDTIRRAVTLQRKVELLGRELNDRETPMDEIELDPHVEDDVLRLMFTACHPVLSVDARVALTLKMVAGLSTEAIARAFLVQTTTMAARITRAKKALAEADVPIRGTGRRRARRPAELRARGRLPGLQRGLHRHRRRAVGTGRAVPGGDAPRPHARRVGGRRVRDACPGGVDGDPGVPTSRPHRARRRARHARQAGPCSLGPVADHARSRRAGSSRGAGRHRLLCDPGEDRRLPRQGAALPRTPTGCASPPCTATSSR